MPRFGLPQFLQSDSGPCFTSHIVKEVAKGLEIKYYLCSAWRSQSSGKAERANHTPKWALMKLWQKAPESWLWSLPIALMRVHNLTKTKFELIWDVMQVISVLQYDSRSRHYDILTIFYQSGPSTTDIHMYRHRFLLAPGPDQVLVKAWRKGTPANH